MEPTFATLETRPLRFQKGKRQRLPLSHVSINFNIVKELVMFHPGKAQ